MSSPDATSVAGMVLRSTNINKFVATGVDTKHHRHNVYHWIDDKDGDKWLIKENNWNEAYASTVCRFFAGPYSQDVQFIVDGNKLHSAVRMAKGFNDIGHGSPAHGIPILPPGCGFGSIVATALLVAECDLKGCTSSNSNMGVLLEIGKPMQYFNIDHEQAFCFGGGTWAPPEFDLQQLLRPTRDMPYLNIFRGMAITPAHLQEIHDAARAIAQRPRADLVTVLDFCERQLQGRVDFTSAHWPPVWRDDIPASNTLKRKPTSYKDAVLQRFDALRALFGVPDEDV